MFAEQVRRRSLFLLIAFGLLQSATALAQTNTTLVPTTYTVLAAGSGATVPSPGNAANTAATLDINDQSGSQWATSKIVQFNAGSSYSGYESYTLPASISPSSITAVQLKVNYSGACYANQVWTWSLWNWVTNAYVAVGNNNGVACWGNWAMLTFNVSGTPASYVRSSDRYMQVGLTANNGVDGMAEDYEALVVTSTNGVNVSVSPTTATLNGGGTQQFVATVTGNSNTAVTWSLTGVGTLSSGGLYTAPATVVNTTTATVKATSVADTTKSASATVTINPVSVSVSPTTASLSQGGTQQFTATVTNGGSTVVTWAVTAGLGTVSSSGLYTAPATITTTSTATVTATSTKDTTKSASAAVTLNAPSGGTAAPGITVVGNQIVTTSAGTLGVTSVNSGQAVVLRGVNIQGQEYNCLSSGSTTPWDPGSLPNAATTAEYQSVVNAILAWHANVVRIPLNEDCWLAKPTAAPVSGSSYMTPIKNFISVANASGLIVEVDLHVGCGSQLCNANSANIDSFPAMDTNYSLQFWQSVAQTAGIGNNPSVIFNLTNEPEFGENVAVTTTDWSCYLNGGCTTSGLTSANGNSWTVQGTQSVVTAIRNLNVTNPIIIAGLDYSNQLNDWLQYVPVDPLNQIIAGVHLYYDLDCTNASCWTSTWSPIQAAGYPVIIDETGEFSCTSTNTQAMTTWADSQNPQVGYWFWAFTAADNGACGAQIGPDLLASPYVALPNYGTFVESHLQSVQ
jgi:endoglucanase